jgi:hypothetical protein
MRRGILQRLPKRLWRKTTEVENDIMRILMPADVEACQCKGRWAAGGAKCSAAIKQ